MSVEHHAGKGYAPLPQSISNTDTEDEEECLARQHDVIHKASTETTTTEPTLLRKNGVFYPLDETTNLSDRARNGQSTLKYYRDDIPIMVIDGNEQNDLWTRRDMSPLRRFSLVASIMLCIATILVFLYILPCDNSMVCPPVVEPQSSISWDRTLQGVELHGPISVIPGCPYTLVFLLRGQRFGINNTNSGDQRQISPEGGGVMSMQGNSGLPLWLVSLKRLPTEIDCLSIDTDRSGVPDCIVAGNQGLLVSIEPIAGTIHWSSMIHTFPKLPVILPDIDSDGIEDLLSVEIGTQPSLVLLTGGTGRLLGRYTPVNCSSIDIYNLAINGTISFACSNAGVMRSMSLKGLLRAAKLSQVYQKLVAKATSSPHVFKMQQLETEKNNWKITPYHYLSVENEGSCPGEFCRASVNLTLQNFSKQPLTMWDHISPNSYASKPAVLVTETKPYTTLFAIKFWQWVDFVPDHAEKASTIVERRIIERALIVFVNYTDVQVMNASQSDIIQLCQDMDCQPNLNSRARYNSISVAYISNDGFPELINYWSSYDAESPTVLTSKVQVVKLESVISNLPRAGM
ncbi:hypothetical protein KM043_007604 [Ampulex compressa]|nr:hypothetical protein KM043_007604 [Ampulex compressa]